MMDWLYNELEQARSAQFSKHVEGCVRCTGELDSLTRTRVAFREMSEVEPPQALTAILLHEAAKRAPAVEPKTEESRGGFGAWLFNIFQPMMMHPAVSAIAAFILVGGVAGALYIKGGQSMVSRPMVRSQAVVDYSDNRNALRASGSPAAAASPSADFAISETAEPYAGQKSDFGYKAAGDQPKEIAKNEMSRGFTSRDKQYAADLIGKEQKKKLLNAFSQNENATLSRSKAKRSKPSDARREAESFRVTGVRPDVDGKLSHERNRTKKRSKTKQPRLRLGQTTNVVSGADPLLSREDFDGEDDDSFGDSFEEEEQADEGGALAVETDAPAPPPSPVTATKAPTRSYRAYKDTSSQKREIEWAKEQELDLSRAVKSMSRAVKSKKRPCQTAARIANDILDRNPEYYAKRIRRSKAVTKCSWYVTNERRKRSSYRAKNRKGGKRRAVEKAAARKKTKSRGGKKRAVEKAAPRPSDSMSE